MKHWMKPSKLEWMSFLALIPLLSILLVLLMFGKPAFGKWETWLIAFPLISLNGLISWYLQITSMHWLRVKLPLISQTTLRLTILAVVHILVVCFSFLLLFTAFDALTFINYSFNGSQFGMAIFGGIALTMVATTMWESDYTFRQLRKSLSEKEKLEHMTMRQEFDALKNQVNPHFLFNCFNTLSSLITEDRKQAEVFLNELSKVYRYLLRNNEDGLSPLKTELRFIESYYRLLRTRHGEAVQLNIETDKKYDGYLLPSLSLQMLVENAVKHNVLSKNKPLVIDIFTTSGNKLVVSNNLQVRTVKALSNGIGLENIRSKYGLLREQGFQVLKDRKNFSVVLPLIWNKVADPKIMTAEY